MASDNAGGGLPGLASGLVARAHARAQALRQKGAMVGLYLVAVAGVPGAGKSHLGNQIVSELGRLDSDSGALGGSVRCMCLPMDGYHYSKAALDGFEDPETAHFRRGAPFTFDSARLLTDLTRCRAEPLTPHAFPGFDHKVGDPVENQYVVDASGSGEDGKDGMNGKETLIVLVEGNYLLLDGPEPWQRLRGLFDEAWFVEVDLETAVQRCAVRNAEAFGWTLERTMARVRASDELNMREVLASDPASKANVVVDNNDFEAVKVSAYACRIAAVPISKQPSSGDSA